MENGATVEVGVVGRDGVVGLSSWGAETNAWTNLYPDTRQWFSRRSKIV